MASGKLMGSVASTFMNQNNLTAASRLQNFPNETGYPVVALADYARLRGLAANHELADELDRAIVVQTELVPKDVVTMHSRCIYLDESLGVRREIELAYPDEADPGTGKVSVLTPVGCALIGLKTGQEIDWDFPDGSVRCLRVMDVRQAPR